MSGRRSLWLLSRLGTRLGERSERPERVVEEVVRPALEQAEALLAADRIPTPGWRGKLLRPLVAYGMVPLRLRSALDHRFWLGTAAVQMVHEASLLHDDILDEAGVRRGSPTLAARSGTGAALALGDHYLTGAYRAAMGLGRADVLRRFVEAVERTVAGERAQIEAVGRTLSEEEYTRIVEGKSGALFGAAAVLGAGVEHRDEGELDARQAVGREVGSLYQRVDDLLDYCPDVERGKPPLQDHCQGKWTWVLNLCPSSDLDRPGGELVDRLFTSGSDDPSPIRKGLLDLRRRSEEISGRLQTLDLSDSLVTTLVERWVATAEAGVAVQERALETGVSSGLNVASTEVSSGGGVDPSPVRSSQGSEVRR